MRRADRLLDILQALRGARLRTAEELGAELGVSPRTIYRDMQTLMAGGASIDSERGIGYLMRDDAFLPPLPLTRPEVEALRLGAELVAALADDETSRAAREALVKVEAVVSERHRPRRPDPLAVLVGLSAEVRRRIGQARRSIRERRKLWLIYRDEAGTASERCIRPLELEFWGAKWTLTAWCELRGAFRVFRLDRCDELTVLPETFADEPGKRIGDYLAHVSQQMQMSPG